MFLECTVRDLSAYESLVKDQGPDVVATLKPYFDAVADPADWRNPISAEVVSTGDAHRVDLTIAAILWFTATPVKVITKECGCCARLQSVGYRNGPAGP